MDMVMIDEWSPRPGELIEFAPTEYAEYRAVHAPPSAIPPSVVQDLHLRNSGAELRRGTVPVSMLARSFTLAGTLDHEALRLAFQYFIRRHETLRSWFVPSGDAEDPVFTRHLFAAEDLELDAVFRGTFDTSATLREQVIDILASRAELLHAGVEHGRFGRWPTFFCGVIDHAGSGFTVIYGADHAHTDGFSLTHALHELVTCYVAFANGTHPCLPQPGSHLEFAAIESALLDSDERYTPGIREVLAVMREQQGEFPQPPVDFGLSDGETAPSVIFRDDLLDGAESAAFSRLCKAAGANFAAGLFACMARTDHVIAGRSRHAWLSLRSTRTEPRYQTAQGWFINLAPVCLNTLPDDSFHDILPRAMAAVRHGRALGMMPLLALLAADADASWLPRAPMPMVSYLDMRRFAATTLPGIHEHNSFRFPLRRGKSTQTWFSRLPGRTSVCMSYPGTSAAKASVEQYFGVFRSILRAVVADAAAAEPKPALPEQIPHTDGAPPVLLEVK